ncbi:uncharacterized protein LOC124161526 [Ischnura elegans]|uniref:uncharacterized protein LOC124161526 n=1 Tax=Ischnura elegans TaxID=197161 RepID=UPI001ED87539|nr:uncharacterized protein LOC124161526 [Ischnura elegans]
MMGIAHLLLLAIYLSLASETDGEEHKTLSASKKKNDLSCYVCEMEDDARCLNMTQRESKWKRKCDESHTMCMVKRFSYTTSNAENATSVVIALERNCSKNCEPGCIIIRTKLSVCTSCCDKPFCNWVSRAISSFEPSSYLLTGIIVAAVIVSLPAS